MVVCYYITDHLGSTRAVVDDAGTVLETFDYYPFGLLMPKRNTANSGTIEKFTGKERDDEGNLNLDYFGARYYDPAISRWLSRDPLASKYPSLSPYNYVANNPINAFDPDGQDIWFVHGTFSDPTTWTSNFDAIAAWESVLDDQIYAHNGVELGNFGWSGGNNRGARTRAARRLASQLAEARERNPEMLVQLVGHSHGGNVSIEAANILKEEYGITVDRLVLLGTPNRSDYQLVEGAVTDVVNVYSSQDEVQTHGGHISSLGMSSRFRKGARNIKAGTVLVNNGDGTFSIKRVGKQGPVSSHVTIHNTQELIDYVNQILNEDEEKERGN